MHRVLIIDNSDSFTHNLLEVFRQLKSCKVEVIYLEDLELGFVYNFDAFVLSPGPGLPNDRKNLNKTIEAIVNSKKPLLGVCLGHQAITQYFSGGIKQLKRIIHGESSNISVFKDELYIDLPSEISVGRYHSWVVDETTFPNELKVTGKTSEGIIMSFCHKNLNIRGVQYHPESILTKEGRKILYNWLNFCVSN